jgi:hypothetical protein
MLQYKATNDKTGEEHIFQAHNSKYARHWVINHCDLSLNWTVKISNPKKCGRPKIADPMKKKKIRSVRVSDEEIMIINKMYGGLPELIRFVCSG